MEVFQCCYTHASRVSGGTASAGWETVAISPGAPGEAIRTCQRLQSAASPNRAIMADESGGTLDLLETAGDGTWLYYIRTRYGHTDSLGRPSMFSHGFLFPWKDVLSDPNAFLSVREDNFQDSEDAAAAWDGTLRRTEPLSLETALRAAGLDRERLALLIRCIYAQMCLEKAPKPLFIAFSGDRTELRALLFCIYTALPPYLRKTLGTASSAHAPNLKKNLIFTPDARQTDHYLIPRTGENNLLTPRMERKIARYGFIDYAAARLAQEEIAPFFRRLEALAGRFGDTSNGQILRLAFPFVFHEGGVGAFTDMELEDALFLSQRLEERTEALERAAAALRAEQQRRA